MNTAEKLLEAIKEQAELFLIESGEFAPYGTYIRANGDLTYVGAYSETTDSEEMYDLLLTGFYDDLKDEDVRICAIGLDGRYEGKDVLIVEFILSPEDRYKFVYPYILESKTVTFGEKFNYNKNLF
ncbi:hypothetical protein [Chryseobacterium fistulae]|uniref:Uncharacterized protein n=1 Tax=Chryseobacterium fistulae TaxID=2675058 RepID=A0A6N4XSN5_9FLAO|nr:hypothetical protein [Chryseobacterium fistulae]CAA7392471.1 hypothetical protein CHRY9393_03191 [Chryseobacterium fistulae]